MDLVLLHQIIDDHFNLDEFQTLCFRVEVEYDDLGGQGQSGKARELIRYLNRRGRIADLLPIIAEERPNLDLSVFRPPPEPETTTPPPAAYTDRIRPVSAGNSISHFRGGAATLGCLVFDRESPHHIYILCDASGLAPAGLSPREGDFILQPGQADGGNLSSDIIAVLSRWLRPVDDPLASAGNISAALAQVQDINDVSPEIHGRGFLKGVRSAHPGMSVFGVGRSSGEVRGQVVQVGAAVELAWPISQVDNPRSTGDGSGYLPILFSELIACTPMIIPGDSGMILLDADNYALGLGFAGGNQQSLFIPIQKVLDALNVDLFTKATWISLTAD